MDEPRISTGRLTIDRLRPEDAEAVFAYRSLPEVSRYQGWTPRSVHEIRAFAETLAGSPFDGPGRWFQLAIRVRGDGAVIGDIGVRFLEDGRQVELGFTIAPGHQRRGYATEAVRAVIDLLFHDLGTHRVSLSIDPRNERSIRLATRLGLRQEGHFRESVWSNGEWADDLRFAILASEWPAGE